MFTVINAAIQSKLGEMRCMPTKFTEYQREGGAVDNVEVYEPASTEIRDEYVDDDLGT